MRVQAWGTHPIAHYGRWLAEHHPEHLVEQLCRPLLQAEPAATP